MNEILLCCVLSDIVFDTESKDKLDIVFKIIGGFVFVEWFWTAIISNEDYE